MKIKAHATLTEKAYHTLVHKIVTLELTPGAVLTESRLIRNAPRDEDRTHADP